MFNKRHIEDIKAMLHRIHGALVVRDLDTARSFEAYEGLRKQVGMAARSRRQHLVQLVELTEALERGASRETLEARLEEWRLQAGLQRFTDPDEPDYFEGHHRDGTPHEVVRPAWVGKADDGSEMLVKQGAVKRAAPRRRPDDSETTASTGSSETGGTAEDGHDGKDSSTESADEEQTG